MSANSIDYYVSTVKQTANVLYKTQNLSGCIKDRRQKKTILVDNTITADCILKASQKAP